jgi:hypothetical protein
MSPPPLPPPAGPPPVAAVVESPAAKEIARHGQAPQALTEEPALVPVAVEGPKADFSGHWILTATEDMGPLLIEAGAPWAARMAAKAAGYGVRRVEQVITQHGDDIDMVVSGIIPFAQSFTANGTDFLCDGPDGKNTLLISGEWVDDNQTLFLTLKKRDGSPAGTSRNYFEGEERISMVMGPKGTQCRRVFSRK